MRFTESCPIFWEDLAGEDYKVDDVAHFKVLSASLIVLKDSTLAKIYLNQIYDNLLSSNHMIM